MSYILKIVNRYFLALFMCFLISIFLNSERTSASDGNLVLSGGFESGSTTPSNWTKSSLSSWDSSTYHLGSRSAKVSSTTGTSWEGWDSDSFSVDAGRIAQVTVSTWVKMTSVVQGATTDNQAKVYIGFVSSSGTTTWRGVELKGTQGWTLQTNTYDVPANTVSAKLSLSLDRATGTVWFDDTSVTVAKTLNLLQNPGFELVPSPADADFPATNWGKLWNGNLYQVDTTTSQSGANSMKIVGAAGTIVGGYQFVNVDESKTPIINVQADVKLDNVALDNITNAPGAARLQLNYSYLDGTGAAVDLDGTVFGGIMTGTRNWTHLNYTLKLPAGTKRVQVIPELKNATGTMWVDNLSVSVESPWLYPTTIEKKNVTGSTLTYYVSVTNRRTVSDTFNVSLDTSALAPFTAAVDQTATPTLSPGASTNVKVTVTIPTGQSVGTTKELTLIATPNGDSSIPQLATIKATVTSAPVSGGTHPYVLNTAAEIAAIKTKMANQTWANDAFNNVTKANATTWLTRSMSVTRYGGSNSGDYVCPGTNTPLTFDYNSPTSHYCPVDGVYYTGEPYDSFWADIWHDNAADALVDLGLSYQLAATSDTNKTAYAAKARDMLLFYTDYELSKTPNIYYGTTFSQSLDDAIWVIRLADAYDLIYATLTDAERANIENNLFRPVIDMLQTDPMSTSNFQAYANAADYIIGSVINDSGYRNTALNEATNGFNYLKNSATLPDGWWWEGSASYHIYALEAFTDVVIAAKNLPTGLSYGYDYSNDTIFRKMSNVLWNFLYPDLTIPTSNDGGKWGRRYGTSFADDVEWAYINFGDNRFAAALNVSYVNQSNTRNGKGALRYGVDSLPATAGMRVESKDFTALGETVMRSNAIPNLVPNAGFEEASLADNTAPSYWSTSGFLWDTSTVFEGSKSAKITGSATAWNGVEQDIPIDGKKVSKVELSGIIKASNVSLSSGYSGKLFIGFVNSSNVVTSWVGQQISGTVDWKRYDNVYDVPSSTVAVRLSLAMDHATGTIWFDNLDLRESNLVENGGFENISLTNSAMPSGWLNSGTGTSLSTTANRGINSAYVLGNASLWKGWYKEVPLKGINVKEVTLSAYVKANTVTSGTGKLYLGFKNASGTTTWVGQTFSGTYTNWTLFTNTYAVPSDTIQVEVSLAIDHGTGEAWFDDVQLSFNKAIDADEADYIRIDHGITGGNHAHFDKLHMDYVGDGELISTDLGQIYGSDKTDNWFKETIAHNTVTVDGISQSKTATGSLNFFGKGPRLQVTDAQTSNSYTGVTLRRMVAMTDDYAIDIYDALSSSAHTYDWSWHGLGSLSLNGITMTSTACTPACSLNPNDHDNGYNYLTNVSQGSVTNTSWNGSWTNGNATLKVTSLEPVSTNIYNETAPGTSNNGNNIPFLIARHSSVSNSRFATVLENYRTNFGSAISIITRSADGKIVIVLVNGETDEFLYDPLGTSGPTGYDYTLIRRKTSDSSLLSIDYYRKPTVVDNSITLVQTMDGTTPYKLENASLSFKGNELRFDVHNTGAQEGGNNGTTNVTITATVYAPGVNTVYVNNALVSSTINGNNVTFTFTKK